MGTIRSANFVEHPSVGMCLDKLMPLQPPRKREKKDMGNKKGLGIFAAAAIIAGSAIANAPLVEYLRDIKIFRAYGSPAITIKYDQLWAARAEIRVNGQEWGYRGLDPTKNNGELAINFNPSSLRMGENLIEVVMVDTRGKTIGKQTTKLNVEQGEDAPIYIRLPRNGESVQGTVEIEIGLGVQQRGTFVSFFVDKQFKAMKNIAPYSFLWDTTRESNGWHEIEVWSFDETQTTRKSPIAKVFIQNPGGRTERRDPSVTDPSVASEVSGGSGVKTKAGAIDSGVEATSVPAMAPVVAKNSVKAPIGKSQGTKVSVGTQAVTVSSRIVMPNKTTTADPTVSGPVSANGIKLIGAPKVTTDPMIKLDYGTRVGNDGPFSIWLDNNKVNFDVQPFVQDGVPFTPFRHLFEAAGGKVDWDHIAKIVNAVGAAGEVTIKIGDLYAKVNGSSVKLETAPFLKSDRTIVPLSFVKDALAVEIEVDTATGHVLITQATKK